MECLEKPLVPTGNQHLIRGPPLMWREGGTKTGSEEHHFTSLSSLLSLPSFPAPFVVLPGHFFPPQTDQRKKSGKNVFGFFFFC